MSDIEAGPERVAPPRPTMVLLPRPPSSLLGYSERKVAGIAMLIGLVLGLIASLAAFGVAAPGGMLRKAFNPSEFHSAIPYAISCVFFWGIAICAFRWRRLQALAQISRRELLDWTIRILESEDGPAVLRNALSLQQNAASPLLRRLRLLMDQWSISPSLQDGESILAGQIMLDAEATARGYSLIRVIVWALPVLGLIGTVLGIADAVGGFANFLGQDVNDVSQIRLKLVDVTGGLSFAFLITLQGLLTSLITMLILSALQSAEERLLAGIQQGIVERFLPLLQRVSPPLVAGGAANDELRFMLQSLLSAIDNLNGHLRQSAVAQQGVEDAFRRLHDGGATAALRDLDRTLSQLAPVLSRLQQPFSFQLVPAQPT
jgi:biopolymer transport protein ExbB/TolQ